MPYHGAHMNLRALTYLGAAAYMRVRPYPDAGIYPDIIFYYRVRPDLDIFGYIGALTYYR